MKVMLFIGVCFHMAAVLAWPGMRSTPPQTVFDEGEYPDHVTMYKDGRIGPPCTVGAHNVAVGPCPTMKQPDPPANSTKGELHTWPNQFVIDWDMYFVPNMSTSPPYSSTPASIPTPYNVTSGKTFYHVDQATGVTSMRETYDSYCIPVFGPITRNNFPCSFINPGETNTSYVLFGEGRPEGVPECCIIGKPFHPPPQDFAFNMPLHYRDNAAGEPVDWNVVWDKDAGPFAYGFRPDSSPAYFYMEGILAPNMLYLWQTFSNFQKGTAPPEGTFNLPQACYSQELAACPGW